MHFNREISFGGSKFRERTVKKKIVCERMTMGRDVIVGSISS